jgi:23S rRNA (cytidine1920-2'-O)/16S rRNA (cytidine1409-2'-O)-methyltransferase
VLAGEVFVGESRADKPGRLVSPDVQITITQRPPFVSRGGQKLANALAAIDLPVSGRNCLDVGASTGGFTDCLLQREASKVVAVDVAYGEFHWRLRNDPRVHVIERQNARELRADKLPYAAQLITIDVSFISLTKVLVPVLDCAAPEFDCLALVKPQFELGRNRVGKGGVVRKAEDRREAILTVATFAQQLGVTVMGFAPANLPGPKGNIETFIWLAEQGRSGGSNDLEATLSEIPGV